MSSGQADLFAQDDAERKALSEPQRSMVRSRLEATIAELEATASFPWRDPLEAVHVENRFERETGLLGEEGAGLWARFDEQMERLHATQFAQDDVELVSAR